MVNKKSEFTSSFFVDCRSLSNWTKAHTEMCALRHSTATDHVANVTDQKCSSKLTYFSVVAMADGLTHACHAVQLTVLLLKNNCAPEDLSAVLCDPDLSKEDRLLACRHATNMNAPHLPATLLGCGRKRTRQQPDEDETRALRIQDIVCSALRLSVAALKTPEKKRPKAVIDAVCMGCNKTDPDQPCLCELSTKQAFPESPLPGLDSPTSAWDASSTLSESDWSPMEVVPPKQVKRAPVVLLPPTPPVAPMQEQMQMQEQVPFSLAQPVSLAQELLPPVTVVRPKRQSGLPHRYLLAPATPLLAVEQAQLPVQLETPQAPPSPPAMAIALPKRQRGRPRKHPLPQAAPVEQKEPETTQALPAVVAPPSPPAAPQPISFASPSLAAMFVRKDRLHPNQNAARQVKGGSWCIKGGLFSFT